MTSHSYRTLDVPVVGGSMRVGVWDPAGAEGTAGVPCVLAIHGVTSSHLAWPFVVQQLPGVRVVAPDLRGRGRSNVLAGAAGMSVHGDDLAAVLDAVDAPSAPVIGHSMGAFVAVVLAHRHPERVERLILVDGGLPLNVPEGLAPEQLVAAILGPTAERLATRWRDASAYTDGFWRTHPAFREDWSLELEEYIAYDLAPDGDAYRPATSYRTTVEDTVDMNTGAALPAALAGLRHPTLLLTVPRGLQNETPGLYPAAHLETLLRDHPGIRHVALPDLNHYTVVMSARGARALGPYLRAEIATAVGAAGH